MEEKDNDSTRTWENVEIIHVNPVRRTVDVKVDGKPGPKRVRVSKGIDMGSSPAPKVRPGDRGNMMRVMRGHYFLTAHMPKDTTKGSRPR